MPLLVRRRSVFGSLLTSKSSDQQPPPVHPSNGSNGSHDTTTVDNSHSQSIIPHPNSLHPGSSKSPPRPVSVAGYRHHSPNSRLSHELHPDDILDSDHHHHDHSAPDHRRSSIMKHRNFSESHLAARAKMDAERQMGLLDRPPIPAVTVEGLVPNIDSTSPTTDERPEMEVHARTLADVLRGDEVKQRSSLLKRASTRASTSSRKNSMDNPGSKKGKLLKWRRGKSMGPRDSYRISTMPNPPDPTAPPSYGDTSDSALAVPVTQLPDHSVSESARSDGSNGSSGDGHIYGSTTTTTHTVSTHTTFFKLPRRSANRNSLFPLPVRLPPPDPEQQHGEEPGPNTPRASTQSRHGDRQSTTPTDHSAGKGLHRAHTQASPTRATGSNSSLSCTNGALAKGSLSFAEPALNMFRHSSDHCRGSATSSPLQPPSRLGLRNRSSTASSFGGRSSRDVDTPPPLSASGRTSTSTAGRSSFGGFLSLSRFRQGSEPHSPRHGSPGTRSKSNSFALSREALVIPEREEGDTPGKYLERLESAVSRSIIAGILSKSSDPFAQAVLRSYTRKFPFFTEPVDMSLRKFLLEAELPKETQQVDRVIQAFADRYHECNPGIFVSSDVAYIIAFSIMMLHTDAFNKNNKRKMQKQDYIKNTSGQGISDDILACFYDNICYTPFIHYDEDVDINGERVLPFQQQKKAGGKFKSAIPGADTTTKRPAGPVDPYNLIVEQKLDTLRPPIKDSILMDDPYDYRGSEGELEPHKLQRAFTHTGVIQIISARSRPTAYENQTTNGTPGPAESQQGIVDLKITKVGLLWRKSARRKKARSPWQEWGALLTGSQLYLFQNSHWAKGLMHQFQNAQKPGQPRVPVVFKPPLQDFKPDALIKTDDAVALVDSTYTRHKNAFTFVRHGGQEEVFLADNEGELNEWLGLINYAAAFRAAGVRIRGMVSGNEDDSQSRGLHRISSATSAQSMPAQMSDSMVQQNRGMSPQLERQVMVARRQLMVGKIAEIEKEIVESNRQLENMLRNARHLLILAPIAPRTREEVILAAGRTDATIKWLRRDMWRMKCHRDILAMDVRIDGMSAPELEKLMHSRLHEPETAKKEKPKMLTRFGSSRTTRSPPQSPVSGSRPITRSSVENTVPEDDGFSTPPESWSPPREEGYAQSPSNLSVGQQDGHRPSITSTLLPASSQSDSRVSLQNSYSTPSVLQVRTRSIDPSESENRDRPTVAATIDPRELPLIAPATVPGDEGLDGRSSMDGLASGTSPENRHKSVRRSLQKTLRDHHRTSHSSKHRRNKESDSTLRSGAPDERDNVEVAPGLARDTPRFILHGKQASVVQFGGDWERMRLRREQYGDQADQYAAQLDAAFARRRSEQHELLRSGMASPLVRNLRSPSAIDGDDDNASILSDSGSFRSDAQAAAAYANIHAAEGPSETAISSSESVAVFPGFDLSDWDPLIGRRTTVIGPSPVDQIPPQVYAPKTPSSPQNGLDGNAEGVENPGSSSPYSASPDDTAVFSTPPATSSNRENRRTVFSDSSPPRTSPVEKEQGRDDDDAPGVDADAYPQVLLLDPGHPLSSTGSDGPTPRTSFSPDEGGFIHTISDEELRNMSSSLH